MSSLSVEKVSRQPGFMDLALAELGFGYRRLRDCCFLYSGCTSLDGR